MFILQTHKDILTDPAYNDCKDAKEFKFPVNLNHALALKDAQFLAEIVDGKVVSVQHLHRVDGVVYVYLKAVTPALISELKFLLKSNIKKSKLKHMVVCEHEGRDLRIPALFYGFTIPEVLLKLGALSEIIGVDNAIKQIEFASQLQKGQELVTNWTPNEELAEYLTSRGLLMVNVTYEI